MPVSAIPAQLGFLSLYNPQLGHGEETLDGQIVYYASPATLRAEKNRQRRRPRTRGVSALVSDGGDLHASPLFSSPRSPPSSLSPAERHQRSRQIGLAQAMVSFAQGFSAGQPVESVDTTTSRIVLRQLEPDWWLLASVDFARIPVPPRLPIHGSSRGHHAQEHHLAEAEDEKPLYEYSSREVKPASLLVQDLLRAHEIFMLHHGGESLAALWQQYARPGADRRYRLEAILARYWNLFLSTWTVVLHGNPARAAFRGINLAACGELGMGVGEEDRGSGEREVLEGFVHRVDGLVDLVVSRFGSGVDDAVADPVPSSSWSFLGPEKPQVAAGQQSWLGTGADPAADDGAIFLGVGALSTPSLRAMTSWMEELYSWGDHAYGVIEGPRSSRRVPGSRSPVKSDRAETGRERIDRREGDVGGKYPGSVDKETGHRNGEAAREDQKDGPNRESRDMIDHDRKENTDESDRVDITGNAENAENAENVLKDSTESKSMDTMVSYLKFGYGTYWSLGRSDSDTTGNTRVRKSSSIESGTNTVNTSTKAISSSYHSSSTKSDSKPDPKADANPTASSVNRDHDNTAGHYLIGLVGNVEERDDVSDSDDDESNASTSSTLNRSVYVHLDDNAKDTTSSQSAQSPPSKLRVVVYVNRPFLYAFLFDPGSPELSSDALYRSLHYQLAPLTAPLLASTSFRASLPPFPPSRAQESKRTRQDAPLATDIASLVYHARRGTVQCSLPNIPDMRQPMLDPPSHRSRHVSTSMPSRHGPSHVVDANNKPASGLTSSLTLANLFLRPSALFGSSPQDVSHDESDDKFTRSSRPTSARRPARSLSASPSNVAFNTGDLGTSTDTHDRPATSSSSQYSSSGLHSSSGHDGMTGSDGGSVRTHRLLPSTFGHGRPNDVVVPCHRVMSPTFSSWSRADAISSHAHILGLLETVSSRSGSRHALTMEKSVKTNRGWWIAWARMDTTSGVDRADTSTLGAGKLTVDVESLHDNSERSQASDDGTLDTTQFERRGPDTFQRLGLVSSEPFEGKKQSESFPEIPQKPPWESSQEASRENLSSPTDTQPQSPSQTQRHSLLPQPSTPFSAQSQCPSPSPSPGPSLDSPPTEAEYQVILLRKAQDTTGRHFFSDSGAGVGDSIQHVARGFGIDTHQYMEMILDVLT